MFFGVRQGQQAGDEVSERKYVDDFKWRCMVKNRI